MINGTSQDVPITLTADGGNAGVFVASETDLVAALSQIGLSFNGVKSLEVFVSDGDSRPYNDPQMPIDTPRDVAMFYSVDSGVVVELNGTLLGQTASDITLQAVTNGVATALSVSWTEDTSDPNAGDVFFVSASALNTAYSNASIPMPHQLKVIIDDGNAQVTDPSVSVWLQAILGTYTESGGLEITLNGDQRDIPRCSNYPYCGWRQCGCFCRV